MKILSFFLIAFLLVPSIRGQVVVSPYDWFQVGAYAKYANTRPPDGLIFPNGTKIFLFNRSPTFSSVLEWAIIGRNGGSVCLNITFFVSCGNITFHKVLLLDVNIYTRDTVIDGEPVGKTCFWAEPYANVGQQIVLYGKPSDQIAGNVTKVMTLNVLGREVKEYFVNVPARIDPCLFMPIWPRFVWHTGMAELIVLVGSRPVAPDEEVCYTVNAGSPNETTYKITRFYSTPLGEKLCFFAGFASYALYLNETNIRLEPENEAEGTSNSSLLKYYPYFLVATVAVSALTFIISYRKRNKTTREQQLLQT